MAILAMLTASAAPVPALGADRLRDELAVLVQEDLGLAARLRELAAQGSGIESRLWRPRFHLRDYESQYRVNRRQSDANATRLREIDRELGRIGAEMRRLGGNGFYDRYKHQCRVIRQWKEGNRTWTRYEYLPAIRLKAELLGFSKDRSRLEAAGIRLRRLIAEQKSLISKEEERLRSLRLEVGRLERRRRWIAERIAELRIKLARERRPPVIVVRRCPRAGVDARLTALGGEARRIRERMKIETGSLRALLGAQLLDAKSLEDLGARMEDETTDLVLDAAGKAYEAVYAYLKERADRSLGVFRRTKAALEAAREQRRLRERVVETLVERRASLRAELRRAKGRGAPAEVRRLEREIRGVGRGIEARRQRVSELARRIRGLELRLRGMDGRVAHWADRAKRVLGYTEVLRAKSAKEAALQLLEKLGIDEVLAEHGRFHAWLSRKLELPKMRLRGAGLHRWAGKVERMLRVRQALRNARKMRTAAAQALRSLAGLRGTVLRMLEHVPGRDLIVPLVRKYLPSLLKVVPVVEYLSALKDITNVVYLRTAHLLATRELRRLERQRGELEQQANRRTQRIDALGRRLQSVAAEQAQLEALRRSRGCKG